METSRQQSPFHAGELEVQDRLGVRDKIGPFAARVIRDHMPEQHRTFYGQLPFVLLGSVDAQGRPWASLVPGAPGFMSTPDERTLSIAATPLPGDPLLGSLNPGTDIGVLGIELETRRRNRMTGKIARAGNNDFAIDVVQAFGNCPQYIQSRAVSFLQQASDPARQLAPERLDHFDQRARDLIESADTLFIATFYSEDTTAVSQGADVSHRGGKPGFVRVEDDRHFAFPDYSGNNHFNTVGNLQLNPKAGFLFVDFDTGGVLYMTGRAEVIWEGEELHAFAGAERFIRFTLEEAVRVEQSLPLGFDFDAYSPMLEHTGSWQEAAETVAADRERNTYLDYEMFDIQPESETVTSFYLRRSDGKALATSEPGQFLPIRLKLPGHEQPVLRTYTISDASNGTHYRLSIKRIGGDALVSTYLHDNAAPGFRLEAMAPRGKFTLDRSSNRPVVLLSAGVGITPMIAMANFIIKEGQRTREFRQTHFIHGARNGKELAFGAHIRELAATNEGLNAHICFSEPRDEDRIGDNFDSEGQVNIALLKTLLPFDDHEFYLCGPPGFMQALYDGLTGLGVRDERIHYESFGPAAILKHNRKPARGSVVGEPADGPVNVSFAASGVESEWSPDQGTLLELAETAGLNPEFACRSGICGTCATRLKCGTVDYVEEPSAPHEDDEVLICCATPRSGAGEESCGRDQGVVLDL